MFPSSFSLKAFSPPKDSSGPAYPFLAKQKTQLGLGGELSKLAIGIKEVKAQEFNHTDVAYFNPKKYKIVDPGLALLGRKEYVIKSLKSGRIRFENMLVAADAPKELICEECEKSYAILRCDACEQIMCDNCADICHPRTVQGTKLHNHEVRNKIRPLNAKDKSKIYKFVDFSLPACDVYEEDYMLLRDITKAGTLVGAKSPVKSNQAHTLPRFKARDKVVFADPESGKDSYGKVISDWDFAHGETAPSITRGWDEKNKTGNWYIVQLIGSLDNVSNIDIILKLNVPPPEPPQLPVIEGAKDIPYREEYNIARRFNLGCDLAEIKKPKGTVKHLISEKEENEMILEGNYYFLLPKLEQRAKAKVEVTKGLTGDEAKVQEGSWAQLQTIDRALGYSEVYCDENPDYFRDPEYIRKAMNILVLPECELVRPEEKLEVLEKAKFAAIDNLLEKIVFKMCFRLMAQGFIRWKSRMEVLKEYRIYFSARKIQANFRRMKCWNVLEQKRAEYEIERVAKIKKFHEQFHYCADDTKYSKTMDSKLYFTTGMYANRYYTILRKYCTKIANFTDRKRKHIIKVSMARWRNYLKMMENQITKVGHFDMHTIDIDDEDEEQARRKTTSEMIRLHQVLKNKGPTKLPEAFDELSYNNIASLSLATKREYDVVRLELLEKTNRAKSPANIDVSRPDSPGKDDSRPNTSASNFSKETSSRPNTKDGDRPGTSPDKPKPTTKAGQKRRKEKVNENVPVDIPPYHPRVGFKDLPALKPIQICKTATERLALMSDKKKRIDYCSYKSYHEGPTPDSCWVIPGKLLMGKCPYKKMFRNSNMIQLSAVMGVGLSHVISLMPEDEEHDMNKDLDVPSIESQMAQALISCKAVKGRAILENEAIVLEQNELLSKIPTYYKSDPRYEQAQREKLRCGARKKLAQGKVEKEKAALKLVPTSCTWLRLPLEHDKVPSMHELMVYLWDIENKLSKGAVIFMYSKEGHGRVGMMAACLLGRLYGLTPHDALYRVQNSHDSQDCESDINRPGVIVHCPQLMIQRKLVEDVLAHTNRIYEGVVQRSQKDPETFNEELRLIRRGAEKALDPTSAFTMPDVGTSTTVNSAASIDSMYSQAMPVVTRSKVSVRMGIDLLKDHNPHINPATLTKTIIKMTPKLRIEEEYKLLEASKPPIGDLFQLELQTQLANVVRDPPDLFYGGEDRHDTSPSRRHSSTVTPKLPLLRTIHDVKPQDLSKL